MSDDRPGVFMAQRIQVPCEFCDALFYAYPYTLARCPRCGSETDLTPPKDES